MRRDVFGTLALDPIDKLLNIFMGLQGFQSAVVSRELPFTKDGVNLLMAN